MQYFGLVNLHVASLLLVLLLPLAPPHAVRRSGATIDVGRKELRLDDLPLSAMSHRDAQLDQSPRVRGIGLDALLALLPRDPALDLILLRFANGMVVPLPAGDKAALARLDPVVVRQIEAPGQPGQLLPPGTFPALPRPPDRADVRPRAFGGNRLLVAERWHPMVPVVPGAPFSPWDAVDTLVGVDRAASAPYFAAFEVQKPTPAQRRGARLFRESCQFCHSVEGHGGRFGWDFLDPDPIYSQGWMRAFRDGQLPLNGASVGKDELSAHVRFHGGTGGARLMPVLSQLTATDVSDLWDWIEGLARERRARATPR